MMARKTAITLYLLPESRCRKDDRFPMWSSSSPFSASSVEIRQILGLCRPHFVEERADLRWRAYGGSEGIEQERITGGFFVALYQRLCHQLVDSHMGAVERRQLFRQGAEMDGLNAVAIHQAGDLDTAIRQVIDQVGIAHIAIYHGRSMERDRLDDVRTILMTALIGDLTGACEHFRDLSLIIRAPGWPVIGIKPRFPTISRATIAFD